MKPVQAESPPALSGDSVAPLESVLCTGELHRRPARPPDYETENRTLVALVQAMTGSPGTILQTMAENMLCMFRAGSSGLSLLTTDDGGKKFYWQAIAGVWKGHIGGGTPREFGPCGDVLDCNAPLLFRHPERRYTYLQAATPAITEVLLVPFYVGGEAVGTLWLVTHDDRRQFDAEDLRQLVGLSRFASSAFQTLAFHEKTVAMNEALLVGAVRQHELMEATENLNAQLQVEIAARQKTAQELSEKARLIDLSNDAIIVRDMNDQIRLWNTGAEKLFGWSFEEVKGKNLHRLLHTQFPKPIEEIIAQLHEAGRFNGEVVQQARDGRWIRSLCGWVLDRETESIFTSYTDITERTRAVEALRTSEERYRTLFTSIDEGFCVVEMLFDEQEQPVDYRFLEVNPAFGKQTGLLDVKGKCVRELIPNHEAHWFEIYGKVALTGEPIRFMNEAKGLGGRWFDVYACRLGEPDSRKVAVIFNDITERKEMSDSLSDRIADLARADRSKDEFLAMLAHELRNPLAPLRNAAEILKAEASDAEREQAQRILGRQIENMGRMIDDLLDVSRITEGKIELRRAPVALESILTSVTSLARSGCAAHRQHLSVSMPAEPVYLDADSTRLEQVFSNLLGNASKYSGEGCEISLSAERAAGVEPPEVIISVRDDGMGIAPELLPRVFDLFVQASRTIDRAYGGLGIGLTLVQRLVKLHGGSVEARSEGLGRGSEFIVRLPILITQPPQQPQTAPSPREMARRILIVDDNTDSAHSLAVLQRLRGHDTRTAFTGPAGVATAAEFLPDVVLLDIGLPGMDGFEVARRLRAMPELSGILLIGMSGYGREQDRAEALAAGFDEYMVKPVDLALLREWMRPRPTASPAATPTP